MLNYPATRDLFDQAWSQYLEAWKELSELLDHEMPKGLRLFDIRFRLALGVQFQFDDRFAYTRTEETRETYRRIMKLNEMWFAWEAMIKWCKSLEITRRDGSKADMFTLEQLEGFGIPGLLGPANQLLQQQLLSRPQRKSDLSGFLGYLIHHPNTNGTQRQILQQVLSDIHDNRPFSHKGLYSLAYASRNVFVHEGDTARTGVRNYRTKIELMRILYDYLVLSLSHMAIYTCSRVRSRHTGE